MKTVPLWQVYGALTLGIICIALSAIFVKWAAVPGSASAFYRVFIASGVLIPWWWVRKRQTASTLSHSALVMTLAAGVFFALDLLLWNIAILLTSAATATLLANNAPVWVGLSAMLLFGERLPFAFWIGMATAFVGITIILGGDLARHLHLGYGDLLALIASFFYAAYLITTQRVRKRLDTLTVLTLSVVTSVVVLLGFCLILKTPLTGYSTKTWMALAGLGLVSQLGGWFALSFALGHMQATIASTSLLAQPVLTALFSIPLLGEYFSTGQFIGGVFVLSGIYLVHRNYRNPA